MVGDMLPAPTLSSMLRDVECRQPVRVTDAAGVECWARCGSREAQVCPSCSRLAQGDWSAIARSGVYDPPTEAGEHSWLFLTLTAPSFGAVHYVPRVNQPPKRARVKHTATAPVYHPGSVDTR